MTIPSIFPDGVLASARELPEAKRSITWAQLARAFGDVALGSGIVNTTEAWKNPHVRACVEANAKAIAALPLTVYRGEERLKSHWLLDLMARPNPMLRLSEYELKAQTVAIRELFGECFWVLERGNGKRGDAKTGPVKAIWIYHPHAVSEVVDRSTGELIAWEFHYEQERFRIDPLDVIQFKRYDPLKHNPKRPSRGSSPLQSALLAVSADIAATRYNLDFFTRGTTPGTVWINKGEIAETREGEFIDRLKAKLAGKGHEPLVLSEGEWDVKNVSQTQKDSEFIQGRAMNRADIGEVFNVPPVVLGNQDAKYDNAEAQLLVWWDMGLSGIMADFCSAIDLGLLYKEADTNCYLDTANVEVLQKRKRERFTAAASLHTNGVPWTVLNEVMDLGLPRFSGDDLALVSYALMDVEDLKSSVLLEDEPDPADPKPEPKDEPPITVQGPDEEDPAETEEPRGIRVVSPVVSVRAEGDDAIRAIIRIILAGNDELKKITKRAHIQAIETGAKQIQEQIGFEALLSIDNPRVTEFLEERGNLIVSVNETTAEKVNKTIRELMDAGTTPETIEDEIRKLYNLRDRQAKLIARQEVGAGLSGGRFLQMEEEGINRHEWMSSRDGRVRESHERMDGEVVEVGEPFSNGLTYPQDPAGDPSEVIGCRCVTVPVVAERAVTVANRDEYWKRAMRPTRTIESALTTKLQRYLYNQRSEVLKALAEITK